jgi:peptidoglycan/xylan/chitin deacetylase (PgdA/CDA1 family)
MGKLTAAIALALTVTVSAVAASPRVPVLVLHRLGEAEPPSERNMSPARFTQLLDLIQARGYITLTVSELAEAMAKGNLPANALALTFDSGHKSARYAAAELARRRLKATFYIPLGAKPPAHLSAEETANIAKNPLFEVGVGSAYLKGEEQRPDTVTAAGELLLSKVRLEPIVGRPITAYASPVGLDPSELGLAAKAAGFTSLALTGKDGNNTATTSQYRLNRVTASGHCTVKALEQLLATGLDQNCQPPPKKRTEKHGNH